MPTPVVSIVVPTYNEREGLQAFLMRVFTVFEANGIAGEVVVVDDASPDGTGEVADSLKAANWPLQVVHRPGKLGLASAVMDGFKVAAAPVLGVMDADSSHDPTILPALVAAVQDGSAQLAVGSRYVPGGGTADWPWFRLLTSRVASAIGHLLSPIRDITSGYFVFRRDVIEGVQLSPIGFKILLEIAVRGHFDRFAEVPFVFTDRVAGHSKFGKREVFNYLTQVWTLWPERAQGLRKKAVSVPAVTSTVPGHPATTV